MQRRVQIILVLGLLLVAVLFFYVHFTGQNPKFGVTFFNIGQGDSALIRFNNGQKMLVDCGPDRKILSKLGSSLPFYDRTIDYLLVTHPDADHYGGCVDVLDQYNVREIITNSSRKDDDPYWQLWNKKMLGEGALIKIMTDPEEWEIGSSTLHFLAPDSSLKLDAKDDGGNNASIVFKLDNAGESFLFTGDMEMPLEDALVQKYCSSTLHDCPALQADILKVGHHGSDSSSGEEFLSEVDPKEAVVSVGKNTFGHPSFRVLKKLQRVGAEILRTDELGDIIKE